MNREIYRNLKGLHEQGFLVRVPNESRPAIRNGYLTILQVISSRYLVTNSYADIPTEVCPLWVARVIETFSYWQNQEEFDTFAGEFIRSFVNWEHLGPVGWDKVFEEFWKFLDTSFSKTTNPNRVANCLLVANQKGKPFREIYLNLFGSILRETSSVESL